MAEKRERLWNRNFWAVMSGNFLLFFAFYLIMPILPLYLRDTFQCTDKMIGIILSGYTITAMIVRPFGGFIVDTWDRKQVLLICYFLFFIFFGGYILATTLIVFALVRIGHGFAFGALTVANSTVAIDVMPASRRGEGIGYYGISNNLACAIGPTMSLYLYDIISDITYLFYFSLLSALLGFVIVATIKMPHKRERVERPPLSLDRFFLTNALPEGATLVFMSFAFGIVSTYLALYAEYVLQLKGVSGLFFMMLAFGLISSRIIFGPWMRRGLLIRNIKIGMIMILVGLMLCVALPYQLTFYMSAFILGLGYGCLCPAYQTVFINLAPNSQRGTANSTYLTSWDVGVGIGILAGGAVAQVSSYVMSYYMAVVVAVIGLIIFYTYTHKHFTAHKLR